MSERTSALRPVNSSGASSGDRRPPSTRRGASGPAASQYVLASQIPALEITTAPRHRRRWRLRMMSGDSPHISPLRRCSTCAGFEQLTGEPRQAGPRQRAAGGQELPHAGALDEIRHEIDEIAFIAVITDVQDRRMRELQRAGLVKKPLAHRIVSIGGAPQDADRHRMTERAVHAAVHGVPGRPVRALLRRRMCRVYSRCCRTGRALGDSQRLGSGIARPWRRSHASASRSWRGRARPRVEHTGSPGHPLLGTGRRLGAPPPAHWSSFERQPPFAISRSGSHRNTSERASTSPRSLSGRHRRQADELSSCQPRPRALLRTFATESTTLWMRPSPKSCATIRGFRSEWTMPAYGRAPGVTDRRADSLQLSTSTAAFGDSSLKAGPLSSSSPERRAGRRRCSRGSNDVGVAKLFADQAFTTRLVGAGLPYRQNHLIATGRPTARRSTAGGADAHLRRPRELPPSPEAGPLRGT